MGCKDCCQKIPTRYIIMAMIFFTSFINYTTKSNISIILPAMVESGGKGFVPECSKSEGPPPSNSNSTSNSTTASPDEDDELDTGERYNWSQSVQSFILAAYFYGFLVGNLPAGSVSEWIGPYWTIFIVTAVTGVLNSLCVWVTPLHWGALFATRFLIGFCGGFYFPALQCLIGRWAPPQERTRFVACLMGNSLGVCLTWVIGGTVIKNHKWPWSFHVMTFEIVVYLIVFSLLTYDSPEQHRWITEEELNYIKESQAGQVSKTKAVAPYKAMFTSFPFWILAVCQFGNLWGLYLQISGVPKFLKEYIGVNIKVAGLLSSLPHLVRACLGIAFGILSDWLRKKKGVRRIIILKSFIILSHIVPGIFMGLMGVIGCHTSVAVVFLVISMSSNGAAVVTVLANPTDLSPNFAGTIFGTITFIVGMAGFIVPSITGEFIHAYGNTVAAWGPIFALGGIIYCLTGVVFMVFGTADTQPWNEKHDETEK